MNAKLTLSLDREVIKQAKRFSRARHKSLSKLIEEYLRQIVLAEESEKQTTSLVARLSGVIDAKKLGDHKSGYDDYPPGCSSLSRKIR